MFRTVLIANRGEIAVRVIRTLRQLGVRSVAVYSDADAEALFVREADEAVRIGPAPARESYLSMKAVIDAAVATGADAIHPGYGFLSENAAFARACAEAGTVFIGPPVPAIEGMGDKIAAKMAVSGAGVPVVPGRHDRGMTDADVRAAVTAVGLPALVKPSAGGGGKGMRVIRQLDQLDDAIESARREAAASFGDDALFVERYIDRPRHIEVQVVADGYGNVVHLFERECSLQRRHQKVIEEAPSVYLDEEQRTRMGYAAVEVARACAYVGVGTVEFIVDGTDPDAFFFLEMNTRLQVEHPVTEAITGVDLVDWQLRIAAGEPIGVRQQDLVRSGHAVEARVYAEDPAAGFLPSGGRLLLVAEPGTGGMPAATGIRVDSAVATGDTVGTDYDPMIAKLIARGSDRAEALARLRQLLADVSYLGVTTNCEFLGNLLQLPEVVSGDLHTNLIEQYPDLTRRRAPDEHVLAALALERLVRLQAPAGGGDPWLISDGWRLGAPVPMGLRLREPGGATVDVEVRGTPTHAEFRIGDGDWQAASVHEHRADSVTVTVAADRRTYRLAHDGQTVWVSGQGATWRVLEVDRLDAESASEAGVDIGAVRSPMPGTVIGVLVAAGDQVAEGQPLVTVEAMKMEHTLTAPADATVERVDVVPGAQVAMDAMLVVLASTTGAGDG